MNIFFLSEVIRGNGFMAISMLFSALCTLLGGRLFLLLKRQLAARVREYTPQTHQKKNTTPCMAGLVIIGSVCTTSLLFVGIHSAIVWLLIGCLILFGAIGLWDDLDKLRNKRGISARQKLVFQIISALCLFVAWRYSYFYSSMFYIPGIALFSVEYSWIHAIWVVFVIVACSNAVNLTDGLDGLAAGCLIPIFALWSVLCVQERMMVPGCWMHVDNLHAIAVVGCSLVGALIGFLWYNRHPARMFMGDVGSLSLGAIMGFIALLLHCEFFLAVAGLVFITETVSVILQVVFFKLYKRRLFKMAPLHHHFELSGYCERSVVAGFRLVSWITCILVYYLAVR